MARNSSPRSGPLPLQTACKPDSVVDDHSSRRRIAAALQQPTRGFRLAGSGLRHRDPSPPGRIGPIRSCPLESAGSIPAYLVLLRVGFTMRRSLLNARCALTAPFHPYRTSCEMRRYILCCTGRPCAFKHKSRTLSGTLPCGVRTFLPRSKFAPRAAAIIWPPAFQVYRSGAVQLQFACFKPSSINTLLRRPRSRIRINGRSIQ